MKKYCLFPVILCLLVSGCKHKPAGMETEEPKEHSLKSELRAFHELSLLPEYRENTLCTQVSTYDTTGKNDDGFSGTYSFIRRNKDSSLVIFDQQGSGVINRFWTPTPTDDTLDFFIDDNLKPAFSIVYRDLFTGTHYPFVAPLCGNQLGGFYCYLPIPFEKSCRIVSHGKRMQFHQIQYRMYETGAKVKSFGIPLNDEDKASLERISALWSIQKRKIQDFYTSKIMTASGHYQLEPGQAVTIFRLNHGGRILGFEISPANSFEGLLKDVDIKITWDGERNPAVFCPLADFFGYAFGKASMQSLLLGTKENKNYCYFPMPFDKEVKIELLYRKVPLATQPAIQFSALIGYSHEQRRPDKEGKFHAYWYKNRTAESGRPHVFLDHSGKGHYVGTLLQAQGLRAGMTYFFEGDDSTSIDGKYRMHGTGSEDYFNGGWYAMMDRWDGKMCLPLHGALDYSLPFCRTGGYRLFLSDKLSFDKSIFHSIEHGPVGNTFPVDYTSIALYYSDAPGSQIIHPETEFTQVFMPDTLIIYPQLMDYNLYGNMNIQTTWKFGTGGESYLFSPGSDETWLRISLSDIPGGSYKVFFDIIREPFGCEFSLWQRQTQVSNWISTFGIAEVAANDVYAGDLSLTDLANSLTIKFRTGEQKTSLMLNRIKLIRKN